MAELAQAERRSFESPSTLSTLLEGRWMLETGSFYLTRPLLKRLAKGDGHPVIVFPGFLASPISTRPMRNLLRDLGYEAYDWGLGRNLRFTPQVEAKMGALVKHIFIKHKRKVSLVGWSLGGVYAREIAKTHSQYVRNVISLGSPITGPNHAARANPLFELLNGKPSPETQKRLDQLHIPPTDVPCTSIFSKTDGIVHWKGSLQDDFPLAENIQVYASHLGMGTSPFVMYLLAERLSQKEGLWSPFDRTGFKKYLFKEAKR